MSLPIIQFKLKSKLTALVIGIVVFLTTILGFYFDGVLKAHFREQAQQQLQHGFDRLALPVIGALVRGTDRALDGLGASDLVATFADLGVTEARLVARLGRPRHQWSARDLGELTVVATSARASTVIVLVPVLFVGVGSGVLVITVAVLV